MQRRFSLHALHGQLRAFGEEFSDSHPAFAGRSLEGAERTSAHAIHPPALHGGLKIAAISARLDRRDVFCDPVRELKWSSTRTVLSVRPAQIKPRMQHDRNKSTAARLHEGLSTNDKARRRPGFASCWTPLLMSVLRNHGASELIADTGALYVIGEARRHIGADRGARRKRERTGREAAEIHVEIFELGAPVLRDLAFDTCARGPASARRRGRADRGERATTGVEAGHGAHGLDLARRK
jgi:hypothetical protein